MFPLMRVLGVLVLSCVGSDAQDSVLDVTYCTTVLGLLVNCTRDCICHLLQV